MSTQSEAAAHCPNYRPQAIGEFGITTRRTFLSAAWLGGLGATLVGCDVSPTGQQASKSVSELEGLLKLPNWVKACSWELVTLPEQNSAPAPGPTDYVALVAVLQSSNNEPGERLSGLHENQGKTAPVMQAFVRTWLPASAAAALSKVGKDVPKTYEARDMARRPVKRGVAVDTPDGLVLYFEYVSP